MFPVSCNFGKLIKYLGGQSGTETNLGFIFEFVDKSNTLWANLRLTHGLTLLTNFFKFGMVAN